MGGLGSIISGLVGSAQGEKSIDMSALLDTIKNAGQYQQQIINALPAQIQQQLSTYAQSQGTNLATLTGQVNKQTDAYTKGLTSIYGPNSEAATAQKTANTQQAYSTVPGTQNAIRNAMAATGGLQRGNAGVSLAQPYVAAAAQAGQANAEVNAQQTQLAQGAAAKALDVVNTMDANLFQTQFGMTQEQAKTILTTGTQTLRDQLSQLLTQSANQTNQTLGVEGIQAQNAYQNALQQQANQGAVWQGLGDLAVTGAMNFAMPGSSGMSGLPAGADVSSANYYANMNASRPGGV